MERKKCNITIPISFVCKLKPENYEIIKQENIIHPEDNLITGIYKTDGFGFIVCCNRNDKTLDYTKFAATEEKANSFYNEMIEEIKKDLER